MIGRARKLDGDLCLMTGQLPDALRCYQESINLCRTANDSIWWASALEGLALTKLLAYAHSIRSARHRPSPPSATLQPAVPLAGLTITDLSNVNPITSNALLLELLDGFEQALNLYSKCLQLPLSSSDYLHPHVYVEAGLRLLQIRTTLWDAHQTGTNSLDHAILDLVGFSYPSPSPTQAVDLHPWASFPNSSQLISSLGSRLYIPQIVTDLVPTHRIRILRQLAVSHLRIGYRRKAAWFQRELAAVITANVNPSTSSDLSGLVKVLEDVCHVFRVRLSTPPTEPIVVTEEELSGDPQAADGWPDLQLGVIQDGMVLSERIGDQLALLRFSLKSAELIQDDLEGERKRMDHSLGLIEQIPRLLKAVHGRLPWSYWGPRKIVMAVELVS